jgi:hypothetical protein
MASQRQRRDPTLTQGNALGPQRKKTYPALKGRPKTTNPIPHTTTIIANHPEYRAFLAKHRVAFDERYVWD